MARTSAGHGHRRWTVVVPRAVSARRQPVTVPDTMEDDVRMFPQTTFLSMVAACAAGLFLYGEKHHTASLDREIGKAYQATQAAHDRIGVLHAEWALLNSPDRLQQMTDQYLSLNPMTAGQYVQLSDLHKHLPDAATATDGGDEVALYTVKINERPAMALTAADPTVGGEQVASAETGPAAPDDAAARAATLNPAPATAAPAAVAPPAPVAIRAKFPRILVPEDPAPVAVAADEPAAPVTAPTAAHPRIVVAQAETSLAERPATPVVKPPAEAYRIMARGGARRAELVSAPEAPATRPGEAAADDVLPRLREKSTQRPPQETLTASAAPSRRLTVQLALAAQRMPGWAAPRDDARVHPSRQPVLLRPELVHELLLQRAYTPQQASRPRLVSVAPLPVLRQHHVGQGRSEPPHDLLLPAHPAPAASSVELDPQDREERSASREEDERVRQAENERPRYVAPYPYPGYGGPYGSPYYAPYGQPYAPYPQYQ